MKVEEDRTFEYYLRIYPSAKENFFDTHHYEQYVSTQMIAGKDVSTQGEAKIYGLRVA